MNVSVPRCGSTWLITPASAADRLDTARSAGADVALLDLEDSVPRHRKNAARAAAIGWLTEVTDGGTTVPRGFSAARPLHRWRFPLGARS